MDGNNKHTLLRLLARAMLSKVFSVETGFKKASPPSPPPTADDVSIQTMTKWILSVPSSQMALQTVWTDELEKRVLAAKCPLSKLDVVVKR